MPHFFIDTDDGRFRVEDEEGGVYDDAEAARDAAVAVLPEMALRKLSGCDRREFAVRLRDVAGMTLYTATLSLVGEWHVGVPPRLKRASPSA